MSEPIFGTAAPAVAAHSKDASAPGSTASRATETRDAEGSGGNWTGPGRASGQVWDQRVRPGQAGVNAGQAGGGQGLAQLFGQQSTTGLLAAAGLGLILGLLLARR